MAVQERYCALSVILFTILIWHDALAPAILLLIWLLTLLAWVLGIVGAFYFLMFVWG